MASAASSKPRKGAGIAFVLPAATEPAAAPVAPATGAAAPAVGGAVAEPTGTVPVVPVAASVSTPTAPAAARPAPRTGVGLLTATVFEAQRLEGRIEALQSEVEKLSSERGAQLMDPRSIVASRWANRHPDSFEGPAFELLQREIQDAGGNVQPIKVRPVGNRADVPAGVLYEIVFGHRRHRACLALGLPVSAVVQPVDDTDLFVQMERENRGRESLSAWEQGRMYLRALEDRLFGSNTKLAAAIGRGVSDIGKAMRIAKLPPEVTGAFPSPNAIQFRWATNLERALQKHPDAVLSAARELSAQKPRPAAAEVFEGLTACLRPVTVGVRPSHPAHRVLALRPDAEGHVRLDAQGRTLIQLPAGTLPPERWDALERALKALL